MFYVEQLPFLHTLGYAIGHSLWQMSLVWLVYTAIINIHRWNSAQRYNLAVSGVIAGFVCFVATLAYFNLQPSAAPITVITINSSDTAAASPANKFLFFYHSLMASLRSLAPYFSCAYLLVMLLLSTRLINGFRQVNQLRTSGLSKAPVEWRLFVNDHAALLGIPKKVILQVSNITNSPLTIGYLKPIILIPLASISNLTPSQLEAVLLHELAHIRRNDYLTNIFLQLAEIVLFFNPFMRLLLKQARIERENCCDDCVLQFRYNAADYAKALLSIQQHSAGNMLTLGIKNKNEFQLLDRVKRMLAPERKAFNYKQQLGLLFLLTLIGLGFTVINPRPKQQPVASATPVTPPAPASINTEKAEAPIAIDLVKKIEDFGHITEAIASTKNKNVEAAVEKTATELEKRIKPHLEKIEDAAKAIEVMVNNNQNSLNINTAGLSGKLNTTLFNQLPAAITEGVKLFGLAELEKLNVDLSEIADNARDAKHNAALEKLQLQITGEQKKLERLTRAHQAKTDSIKQVFSNSQVVINQNRQAVDRAAKEIAIAPFRVWNKRGVSIPAGNFTFNLPGIEIEPAQPFAAIAAPAAPRTPPATVYFSQGDCNCPADNKNRQTTVTVINGKQLAATVKKVWAEAQAELKDNWTPDMQQKILNEIKLELKSIENIEIKTHVNANGKSKSFVIEVETSE